MKKRILSLGIACCLVFNALPGAVRAEGEEPFVQEEVAEETEAESVEPEVSEEEVSEEEQSEQTESKEKSDAAETTEEIVTPEETDSENPDADLEEPGEAADEEATVEEETEDTITPEEASVTEDPTASEQTVPGTENVETAEAEEAAISTLAAEPVGENVIALLAEEKEQTVTTDKELANALNDNNVDKIYISGSIRYTDSIETDKAIVVKADATFTWSVYQKTFETGGLTIEAGGKFEVKPYAYLSKAVVKGIVTNNGTVRVSGNGECFWTAEMSGSGQFIAMKETYISYGKVSAAMLEGKKAGTDYCINILDDLNKEATVSLPSNMEVGQTITPMVENLIDGVELAKVFKFKWIYKNSYEIYNGAANPTLTKSGALKLTLSMQTGYKMQRLDGSNGSIDATGEVAPKEYDILYVDQTMGSNDYIGNEKAAPLKSLRKAAENIKANGTIILLSDYTGSAEFKKSATVKSQDGETYSLGQTDYSWIGEDSADVTVTLENLTLNRFALSDYSTSYDGKLVVKNCKGTIQDKSKPIKNIELENSELYDSVNNVENLTLTNTSIEGRVYTKNLTLIGENTITPVKNSPSLVEGTLTGEGTLQFNIENPEKWGYVLEVKEGTETDALKKLQLTDSKNDQFRLKIYKAYNGTYISVAERVTADGTIAVGKEPALQQEVDMKEYFRANGSKYLSKSSVWSGYADKENKKWTAGDTPELTVTIHLYDVYAPDYFFDNQFQPDAMKVYSWKDLNTFPNYTEEYLNNFAKILVKEGQGASEDGDSFTFTIVYPEVTLLDQTINTDCSDRTAYCNDTLEAREAKAETTISYESSDPEIASVDAVTGVITAHKPGIVQIIIKAKETEFYKETQVSYQLTVSHHPVTVPEAVSGLIYNGKAQALITQQPTVEGTMMYKVNDGEWQEELPTASVAGTYTISYKAYMGEKHGETEAQHLEVTILPKKATVTPDSAYKVHGAEDPELTWTAEGLIPGDSLKEITVKRAAGDKVGTYEITAEQKENANPNYDLTFEKGVFTVIPAVADETLELGKGSVSLKTEAGEGIGSVTADVSETELLKMLMKNGTITSEELVQLVNGASMELVFTVKEITSSISESSKAQFQKAAGDYTIGQYLDISIYKYLIVNGSRGEAQPVHETGEKIALAIQVSESLAAANKNTDRTYRLLRNHEGTVEIIDGTYLADTKTYKFESDKFSDYAVAYKDVTKTASKTDKKKHHKSGSSANEAETAAAETTAAANGVSAAATGDQTQVTGYGVLFLISLAALTTMLRRKRKF